MPIAPEPPRRPEQEPAYIGRVRNQGFCDDAAVLEHALRAIAAAGDVAIAQLNLQFDRSTLGQLAADRIDLVREEVAGADRA